VVNGDSSRHLIDPTKHTDAGRCHLWDLGRLILDRQATYGWGAKIVVRLAADLQREFPDIKGLSAGNLHYMRRFATVWPDRANLPTAVGKIPWGHNRLLLDRLSDTDERAWYAAATIEYGWSRERPTPLQIGGGPRESSGSGSSDLATCC
jgi:hypothetical protein